MTNKKDGISLSWLIGCFQLAVVFAPTIFCSGNYASAQIIPDETLGNNPSTIIPNVDIKGLTADRIDGGVIRGANLFHSFREFNVGESQSVYFVNPPGINNILTRVTGSNISNILGTLGVDGTANLFLLNPNGIIFGKNASLDVRNSFYVTTASSIQFGNRGDFSAINPRSPSSLLTINPSAFFFNQTANPGSIVNQSRATQTLDGTLTDGLQVPNGKTLLLLGGNVTVDDGRLIARGGRVEIGAVAGTGSVGLNANGSLSFPDTIQRADVVFTNQASANRSGIDVRFANAGDIGITAGNINLYSGSQLRAGIASGLGSLGSQGGDLIINATGEVRMTGEDTRMANDVRSDAIGKAGNIKVTSNSLAVTDGAQLSSSTFGIGDGGNVEIVADRVLFSGVRADERGVSAAYSRVEEGAKGNGGSVQIFTKDLEVSNGAQLSSDTNDIGNAGNVIIQASDRVSFKGISPNRRIASGALSNVLINAQGKGGNVQISTKTLEISKGAQLGAGTIGRGDGGSIIINAKDTVWIDGPSLVFTSVVSNGTGNSGNIDITTDSLTVTNGATVSVATSGHGNAGQLRIRASKSVDVVGTLLNAKSQITAAVTPDGTGSGGSLQIDTEKMIVRDGAEVTVSSFGTGVAGNLDIQARSLSLDKQSSISAITKSGNGGNITLNLQGLLLLRRGSQISTNAGNSQFGGDGGNITINSPFIVAVPNENNDITANAFKGAGGKIQINATGIFGISPLSRQALERLRPGDLDPRQLLTNDITALSQQNPSLSGTVQITTPDADPSHGLAELPSNLVDVSGQIANGCIPGSRQSQSSFIATGRGGLPLSPNQPLQDTTMLSDWVRVGDKPATSHQVQVTPVLAKSATQIVEAQGWVVDGNGNLVLVAQTPQTNPRSSWQAPMSCPAL